MLVLDDADLDRAAAAANLGAFMHQGQICMSTERLVVDRSVAGPLADKLAGRARSLVVGDPHDPGTQIGPLVQPGRGAARGRARPGRGGKGAQVLSGGRADGPAYVPTVLRGVTPQMRIYQRGVLWPGHLDRGGGRARTRPSEWPTTPRRAVLVRVHRRRERGEAVARRRRSVCATSTTRPCTTSPRCPSGASRPAAGSLRRPGGRRGVHRTALDHRAGRAARVPDSETPLRYG